MIFISPPVGSGGGGIEYVDRGDPVSPDFTQVTLTENGTWQDLDLSGIVPEGAIAVELIVQIRDNTPANNLMFRKKGNATDVNVLSLSINVNNESIDAKAFVFLDANRVIQYWATNTGWNTIKVTVGGWII